MDARKSGLQEFVATIADWKSLGPYLFGGASAAPLLDVVLHVGPIWPEKSPLVFTAAVAAANCFAFHSMHLWKQKRLRLVVGKGLLAVFVFGTLYLTAWTLFALPCDGVEGRIAVGLRLQPEASQQLRLASELPMSVDMPRTPQQLLQIAVKNNADRVSPSDTALGYWLPVGVFAVRFGLILLWILTIGGLGWTGMAFIMYHRRRSVSDRAASGSVSSDKHPRSPVSKSLDDDKSTA